MSTSLPVDITSQRDLDLYSLGLDLIWLDMYQNAIPLSEACDAAGNLVDWYHYCDQHGIQWDLPRTITYVEQADYLIQRQELVDEGEHDWQRYLDNVYIEENMENDDVISADVDSDAETVVYEWSDHE